MTRSWRSELTGVDEVKPTTAMADRVAGRRRTRGGNLRRVRARRRLRREPRRAAPGADARLAADPWDGRTPRESRFRELLILRNPRTELRNLTPILDELRSIKSPREIALIRRASQLAGLGLIEAMRSTEAGVYEYQLDAAARYVFIVNGARLDAYRPITASGTENINNMHYYRSAGSWRTATSC